MSQKMAKGGEEIKSLIFLKKMVEIIVANQQLEEFENFTRFTSYRFDNG